MPPITAIKNSFTGGEFAPALYARTDLKKYSTGTKTLRNMIVHPHGGISNRAGLEYIDKGKTSGKKIRLLPFEFSTTQTYVVEFGDYYARFYTDGAQLEDDTSFDLYTKAVMHNNAAPFTDEVGKTVTSVANPFIKLLIDFDGSDAATTHTATTGQTVTFGGTAALDTAQKVFGTASGLADGDSDYWSLPHSADWDFAAGDFTVDFRVRFNSVAATNQVLLSQFPTAPNRAWQIIYNNSDGIRFNYTTDGSTSRGSFKAWTAIADTWYHVAVIRNGSEVKIFIDGTQVGTTDNIGMLTIHNSTDLLYIGKRNEAAEDFFLNGWIDELRISKGIAQWTANFTKPAAAYGAPEPTLDTSAKELGVGSALFEGGYLTFADSADWNFGSGNFSIDTWASFSTLSGKQGIIGQYEDSDNYWILGKDSSNKLYMIFRTGGSYVGYYSTTAAVSLSVDTFYHLEFTRNANNAYIFVDGVSLSLTTTTSFGSSDMGDVAGTLRIGYDEVNTSLLYGNLDELRVSKGVARHTAGFTPETSEYSVGGTACEVVTPYAEADLAKISFTQSADVLYLAHPDYAPRQLERNSATDWSLNLYDYTYGPYQVSNSDTSKTIAISAVSGDDKTLTAAGFTFNALHISSLWKLRHYIEGQAKTQALGSVTATTGIACGGTWRLITHGTWTGVIRIEKSTDGSTWTMLREFSSADDFNANTYGTETMSDYNLPFTIRINMTVHSGGTCNINLTSDAYYHEGVVKITAVAAGGVTATADVERACGLTSATDDWAEGSWCDYRGWPSYVEFHPEDRLIWANTYNEPQTYWMTASANYKSFVRNSPLQDADGISSPLPSRQVNGINGFLALSEIIALTLSNEVSIQSSGGPLTPTTAYNRVHGWEGSYGVRPLVIGNRGIYVQSTGSIIRDLGFELNQNSFVGADLTIFSNHLFDGYTIEEMDYQQNPDRIVWAVRSDGKLLAMTYMREQEVIAWTWHDTNDGTDLFESVCCISNDDYDEVWVSVNRSGVRCIERLDNRLSSTDPEDSFFVDSGTKYDGVETITITDLTHLASKAVSVLADGVVVSGKTVSAAGVLTLDTAALVVNVGLGYKSDLKTLSIDLPLEDGTAQGRKIKVSKTIFRVLNSRGGYTGKDEDNLYAMGMGSSSALFSGDHPQTIAGGYTSGGEIFFRQTDPLPISISAIIPQVTVGGMTHTTQ